MTWNRYKVSRKLVFQHTCLAVIIPMKKLQL